MISEICCKILWEMKGARKLAGKLSFGGWMGFEHIEMMRKGWA